MSQTQAAPSCCGGQHHRRLLRRGAHYIHAEGLEPTTRPFREDCSTTELRTVTSYRRSRRLFLRREALSAPTRRGGLFIHELETRLSQCSQIINRRPFERHRRDSVTVDPQSIKLHHDVSIACVREVKRILHARATTTPDCDPEPISIRLHLLPYLLRRDKRCVGQDKRPVLIWSYDDGLMLLAVVLLLQRFDHRITSSGPKTLTIPLSSRFRSINASPKSFNLRKQRLRAGASFLSVSFSSTRSSLPRSSSVLASIHSFVSITVLRSIVHLENCSLSVLSIIASVDDSLEIVLDTASK